MTLPIQPYTSEGQLRAVDRLLQKIATERTAVQVKLRDISPHPLGPGIVEPYGGIEGIFQITGEAISQMTGQFGTQQKRVMMPFVFSVADVLWISLPPLPLDDERAGKNLVIGS